MNITVTGKITKMGFGFGVWALVTSEGNTYQLKDIPESLRQELDQVSIEGNIREDIMTMAMVGPVLEIKSYNII